MRALVTGASSGIGAALARHLASQGDSVVLVARGEAALQSLRSQLPGDGHEILVADLSKPDGVACVRLRLQQEADPIDVLVHSAGIGLPPGGYLGNPVEASLAVSDLNVDVVTQLTHAALPGMLARGRGGVLTVGSIAGFLPGSPAITYAAAKAWTHAFGEGLNELTRRTPVTSTVVAPGFVRSGFHSSAGLEPSGIHAFLWCSPDMVARAALEGFRRGKALVVPGPVWKLVYALARVTPRSWSRAAFARYMALTARRSS